MLLGQVVPYTAPSWMPADMLTPTHRIVLTHGPTPVQCVKLPGLPESMPAIYVKRDDMTGGIECGGNKIRKLEFILADAKAGGHDAVITAGGTQSNHCRATCAAARMVGLTPHLLLRDDAHDDGGNFFLDQLFGADLRVLPRPLFLERGGFDYFIKEKQQQLVAAGRRPYTVPIGGSSPLGCWGYVECMREIAGQLAQLEPALGGAAFSDVVVTTGSGGTIAGLGLGARYFNRSNTNNKNGPLAIRAYSVCDTPEYFHDMVNDLSARIFENSGDKPGDSRSFLDIRGARGLGYSKASTEELQFLNAVARESGIVLDRAYTNKAMFQLARDLASGALAPKGKVMFVHTGGGPSAFDQHRKILMCEGWSDPTDTTTNAPAAHGKMM